MNYQYLSDALRHYTINKGYYYVEEAPWVVCRDAYYATKPKDAIDIAVDLQDPVSGLKLRGVHSPSQYAVASGEQSFLHMMLHGSIFKRAVCLTPCFRYEQSYDKWRLPEFMKVELIDAHDVDLAHLIKMISDALSFFEPLIPTGVSIIETKTGEFPSYDIVTKKSKIELGSYGIREVTLFDKKYKWVYGTGCAEPRLSTAKNSTFFG